MISKYLGVRRFFALVKPNARAVFDEDILNVIPQRSLLSKILYLANPNLKIKHALLLAFILALSLLFLDFVTWSFVVLISLSIGFLLLIYLARVAQNRFRQEFPFFLLSLKSLLKAGLDCVQAVRVSLENFPESSLIYREFQDFISNVRKFDFQTATMKLGENMEVSVNFLGYTLHILRPYNSLILFRSALVLSSQEGASLSGFLERVVRYCRISENFSQRVKSATVMQLISGFVIAFLAILPLAYKFMSDKQAFFDLVTDPFGSKVIFFGGLLVVVGLIALNVICNKKL
ncbi:MAG: hypothetical protein NZT61_04235 [Deltaproteobacteria bacterium]|nr:hypothetical protein [Deltaproteobacteria bacterium]MCX7952469.1 hypothetical protein [Deltaproteobacteria bacterium]